MIKAKGSKKILSTMLVAITVFSMFMATTVGANTASPRLMQVGLCLDGSSSISPSDWDIIKSGVAEAIRNNLTHDGSVELTVVQFGFDAPLRSKVEVPPTVVTATNYETIATTIEAMAQGDDMTPMAHGLNLTWFTMKNSPDFDPDLTQKINVATDGASNIDLQGNKDSTSAAYDVTWVRDQSATEGLDEIDAEGIGVTADTLEWMREGLVWPQPGIIAPPHTPGWVEHVENAIAFAAAMATKLEMITETPRSIKEDALLELEVLYDETGSCLIKWAKRYVEKSLCNSLWMDDWHLTDEVMCKCFFKGKLAFCWEAIGTWLLEKALRKCYFTPEQKTEIMNIIGKLVKADRMLAQTVIEEKEIPEDHCCWRWLNKGNEICDCLEAGGKSTCLKRYSIVIACYGIAWQCAMRYD